MKKKIAAAFIRNSECPNYRDCLKTAALKDSDINCPACSMFKTRSWHPTHSEINGSIRLLGVLTNKISIEELWR